MNVRSAEHDQLSTNPQQTKKLNKKQKDLRLNVSAHVILRKVDEGKTFKRNETSLFFDRKRNIMLNHLL